MKTKPKRRKKVTRKRRMASDGANLKLFDASFTNGQWRYKSIPILAKNKAVAENTARKLKKPFGAMYIFSHISEITLYHD